MAVAAGGGHAGLTPGQVEKARALAHRAVESSEVAFVISNPNAPDNPLVWVNAAFELLTGFSALASVGRNCRFLQGPGTDQPTVARIREALAANGVAVATLLNYRADGTAFWNSIVISPMRDEHGRITHHVGVQSDVTAQVQADAELAEALRRARTALAASQRANTGLATLGEASLALAASLDGDADVLAGLVEAIAPRTAGWVSAAALDEHGRITRVVVAGGPGTTSGRAAAAAESWALGPGATLLAPLIAQVIRYPRATTMALGSSRLAGLALPAPLTAQLLQHGSIAVAAIGLFARGAAVGVLAQIGLGGEFDAHDAALLTDLGARAGMVLDNQRMFAREHTAAVTLQRSLLPPELVQPAGFEVAALYRPADSHAEAGGDWYDLTVPSAGGAGFVATVGDVMGHDMAAAASMGQLRSVLRSQALGGAPAGHALAALDAFVAGLQPMVLATCAYLTIGPGPDGGYVAGALSAGHPPPLLRGPDGTVSALPISLRPPIGADIGSDYAGIAASVCDVPPGSTLVLYTDGLIERRGADLQTGIDTLAEALAAADPAYTAQQLCDHLVAVLISDHRDDDTCVFVLRRL